MVKSQGRPRPGPRNTRSLSDGFVKSLSADLDGMPNAGGIAAGELTGSQSHVAAGNIFVFIRSEVPWLFSVL
jgi:hypothetical protein